MALECGLCPPQDIGLGEHWAMSAMQGVCNLAHPPTQGGPQGSGSPPPPEDRAWLVDPVGEMDTGRPLMVVQLRVGLCRRTARCTGHVSRREVGLAVLGTAVSLSTQPATAFPQEEEMDPIPATRYIKLPSGVVYADQTPS